MVPNNIKTQLLYQNKTKTLTKYPILTKLPSKSNQNLVNQSVLYLPTPTETADQWDASIKQERRLIRSAKWYQEFGTLNPSIQSFVNSITPIGCGHWLTQEKLKQAIYKCTKYTSQYK